MVPVTAKWMIKQDRLQGMATLCLTKHYHGVSTGSYSEPIRICFPGPPSFARIVMKKATAVMPNLRLHKPMGDVMMGFTLECSTSVSNKYFSSR